MPDTQTSLAAAEQALASAEKTLAAKSSIAPTRIAAVVTAWVATSLAGGPIARSTDSWNQLQAALPALTNALATALQKEII